MGSQITEVSLDTPGTVFQVHPDFLGSWKMPALSTGNAGGDGSCSANPSCSKRCKGTVTLPGFPWDQSEVREDQGHGMLLKRSLWDGDGFPDALARVWQGLCPWHPSGVSSVPQGLCSHHRPFLLHLQGSLGVSRQQQLHRGQGLLTPECNTGLFVSSQKETKMFLQERIPAQAT